MTVKELIRELEKYSGDMEITSCAADCGGYDVIYVNEIVVKPWEEHHIPKDENLRGNDKKWNTDYIHNNFGEQLGKLYVGGKDETL